MTDKSSLQQYFTDVARLIREKEAYMRRGNLAQLEELETLSDQYLVTKWAWFSAILGIAFSFLGLPVVLYAIGGLLHPVLREFFWAVAKVSMGMTLLMFCAAIYFTINKRE